MVDPRQCSKAEEELFFLFNAIFFFALPQTPEKKPRKRGSEDVTYFSLLCPCARAREESAVLLGKENIVWVLECFHTHQHKRT